MTQKLFHIRALTIFASLVLTAIMTGCLGIGNSNDSSDQAAGQQLVVRGLSKIMSGDCRAYTIAVETSSGSVANLNPNTTLSIEVGGSGSYLDSAGDPVLTPSQAIVYSDDACTSPTSSVTIPSTTQSVLVYLQDIHVESLLLYASTSDGSLSAGAITVSTFGATQLSVAAPTNVLAGLCSSAFTVTTVDSTGTAYLVLSDTQVNLSSTMGAFYADKACTQPITSAMVSSGDFSTTFFYKGNTPNPTQSIVTTESTARLTGMTVALAVLQPATLTFGGSTAFGNVAIGTTSTKTYTIANSGDVSATNVAFTISNTAGTLFQYLGGTFPGTGGTCTNTIAKGTACAVFVSISPTAESTYSGTLSFTYNNGVSAQSPTNQTFAATGFFNSGSLDTGFGQAGIGTTTVASDVTRAIATQSNGSIVVASTTTTNSVKSILVSRFTSLGLLDTTFNTTGNFTFSSSVNTAAAGIAVDTDGTILVAGTSGTGTTATFLIFRLSAAGALLSQATHAVSGTGDTARAMVLQPNESIVVAGVSGTSCSVMRVTSNLSLDSTFNTNGLLTFTMGSSPSVNAVAVDNAGNIVIGGSSGGTIAFARLTTEGAFDSTFNSVTSGSPAVTTFGTLILTQAGSATGLAFTTINNTQRIVASAVAGTSIAAVRLLTTGTPDTTFGNSGGIATPSISSSATTADAIVMESTNGVADGKILISGKIGTSLGVVRLTAGGAKDTTFNTTGFNSVAIGTSSEGFGIAIQPVSNRIIVGGTSGSSVVVTRWVP